MGIDSLLYRLAYRSGTPRWDSTEPRPELKGLVSGRAPGRALDPGCGTGSDVRYLASLGWDATGVDFVPRAIATARSRAAASGSPASFAVGDVTRLREAGLDGQFDLVIDIGARGLGAGDLRRRFGADFELVDERTAGRIGRAGTLVFYHLVRCAPVRRARRPVSFPSEASRPAAGRGRVTGRGRR